jgi:hypothetical protein
MLFRGVEGGNVYFSKLVNDLIDSRPFKVSIYLSYTRITRFKTRAGFLIDQIQHVCSPGWQFG